MSWLTWLTSRCTHGYSDWSWSLKIQDLSHSGPIWPNLLPTLTSLPSHMRYFVWFCPNIQCCLKLSLISALWTSQLHQFFIFHYLHAKLIRFKDIFLWNYTPSASYEYSRWHIVVKITSRLLRDTARTHRHVTSLCVVCEHRSPDTLSPPAPPPCAARLCCCQGNTCCCLSMI